MSYYVDSDAILAVVKKDDHLKARAISFFRSQPKERLATSSLALLEVWFYLKKNNITQVAEYLESAQQLVGQILPLPAELFEPAAALSERANLNPADSLHAIMALSFEGIVSTDACFDRVKGLRCIRF